LTSLYTFVAFEHYFGLKYKLYKSYFSCWSQLLLVMLEQVDHPTTLIALGLEE